MSSTDEPRPWAWLAPLAEALDELGVRWAVAGALAADRYRTTQRFTVDLDLLVGWSDAIPEAMEKLGYDILLIADPDEPPHLVRLRSATERVDLLVALVEYQHVALARSAAHHLLTVEDVLVHKLISWRPKDQDDVASILATGRELDEAYIAQWAAAWEVADRWDDVRPHR